MAKHTIKERLVAGLQAKGWQPCPKRTTSKLQAFEKAGVRSVVFVGVNGALRSGRTASDSYSLERTAAYADVLSYGTAVLEAKDNPAQRYA